MNNSTTFAPFGTTKPNCPRCNGYVYIIRSDGGHYKIGKSVRPYDRVGQFTLQLPFKVEIIHIIACDDYSAVEKFLHKLYRYDHINGEWFNIQSERLKWLLKFKWVTKAGLTDLCFYLGKIHEEPSEAAVTMLDWNIYMFGGFRPYNVVNRRWL